jgi:uncharacterized membrane protein YhhN
MNSQLNRIVTSIFLGLLVADLFALHFNIAWLHFGSKPLLMPALILLVSSSETIAQYKYKKIIIAALFFSWLGDCALLFGEKTTFFIAGLLCFLTAHIFYIIYLHKYKSSAGENWFSNHLWVALPVISYSIVLLYYLLPMLGGMKVPVAIYTCVITIMLLKAIASKNGMQPKSYWWFVGGAGLFVLSDSVLAINRFASPFAQSSFIIMITYCAAQWMIVQGVLINGKVAVEEIESSPFSK